MVHAVASAPSKMALSPASLMPLGREGRLVIYSRKRINADHRGYGRNREGDISHVRRDSSACNGAFFERPAQTLAILLVDGQLAPNRAPSAHSVYRPQRC
jgi:hypothetical protein